MLTAVHTSLVKIKLTHYRNSQTIDYLVTFPFRND